MRLYCFNNMYLAGIHGGIQSQHSTAELFVKYNPTAQGITPEVHEKLTDKVNKVYCWAENHKTTIVLNAGYLSRLENLKDFLSSKDNPHPWACFNESREALGGVLTNICVVVPEYLYEAPKTEYNMCLADYKDKYPLDDSVQNMSLFDYELKQEIDVCRLMS